MTCSKNVEQLKAENERLKSLLEKNGISWQEECQERSSELDANDNHSATQSTLTPSEKIKLFRNLFCGRTDVFPVRWENHKGKSGYSPACDNEWKSGVCKKPQIQCGACNVSAFTPTSDQVVYDHLSGKRTMGVYPLRTDDSCVLLAVDFDGADWRSDVRGYAKSCEDLGIPVSVEISRSGNGAHAWIFFSSSISAREARHLGTALLSYTCAQSKQLELQSYDRLFPNQDRMPKGGFGNLIVLPLQKHPRSSGCSVFVDENFVPYPDQWEYLNSVKRMNPKDIEPILLKATGGKHALDVAFIEAEELAMPWKRRSGASQVLSGSIPECITITFANLLYFEKSELPQALSNRLIRLAAFQNPEFYKAQKMRFSTWDKPRVIGCAENFPNHIGLPRGCLDDVIDLLNVNNIKYEMIDERVAGNPINLTFLGSLRLDQEAAVSGILNHDFGVLCAPTAFGKTVSAAAIIARRKVSTLVVMHRKDLLVQWKEQLGAILDIGVDNIGVIGAGKSKANGIIDIALNQTLCRKGEVMNVVESYGQVIVDECHHVGAVSFEAILKQAKAKYVLGLTATPIRRDGKQPVIFMCIGPIRYTAIKPASAPQDLEVIPQKISTSIEMPEGTGIQSIYQHLVNDEARTENIVTKIVQLFSEGRKILVLTERKEHLEIIYSMLNKHVEDVFVLHGGIKTKARSAAIDALKKLSPTEPRIILAIGKLIGEGFDHPPLDTLILTMPVSWKGTLQQYAGRLHREHTGKKNVRIFDFVDYGHPVLLRMWDKRKRGYRSMGYRIDDSDQVAET